MPKRWSRNEAIANSLPTDLWPTVSEESIRHEDLGIFSSHRDAIKFYFAGSPLEEIQQKTGVHQTQLPRLAKKCLQLGDDGRILGFRALVPFARIGPHKRELPLGDKRPEQQGGQTGALRLTLERFPDLEEDLVKRIIQDAKHREIPEFKLSPTNLHRIFISALRSKNVPDTEWPFNTKYRGLRSIQNYMNEVLHKNFRRSVMTRGDSAAQAHAAVGNGYTSFLNFPEPYDAVEIDAYHIDAHLTVAFPTPEGTETELLLERLWLIAVVDRASTAILSYEVVYRSEVTADDVVRVIRDAVTKRWKPMEMTVPFIYPPGGGLPSGVIDEAFGACWNTTLFDGALAHLAEAVHERVRKTLGFVLTWGAVKHFERRPNVEKTFNQIAKDIFKRLPTTTGSNPSNGRAKDGEAKALRYKVRAAEAEQMLDVYIAQHNETPSEGISFLTPIGFIRYFLEQKSHSFMLRHLPNQIMDKVHLFAKRIFVTVRGNIETGRYPYIQLDRCHYTSAVLAQLGTLIGTKILIEIDEEDMRQVKAFMPNGAELGFLTAKGRWSITKHSRRTRLAINSLIHSRVIKVSEHADPVRIYLQHLSKPTNQKKNGPPVSARHATDITRVSNESSIQPIIGKQKEAISPDKSKNGAEQLQHAAGRRSLIDTPMPITGKIKNRR